MYIWHILICRKERNINYVQHLKENSGLSLDKNLEQVIWRPLKVPPKKKCEPIYDVPNMRHDKNYKRIPNDDTEYIEMNSIPTLDKRITEEITPAL